MAQWRLKKDDPQDPEVLETIRVVVSTRTTSYEEEVEAMKTALDWIRTNTDDDICTDSKLLFDALVGGGDKIASVAKIFAGIETRVSVSVSWFRITRTYQAPSSQKRLRKKRQAQAKNAPIKENLRK